MSDRPTISDYEYTRKLKIPPTIHIGLKWKDRQGHECESVVPKCRYINGKRVARLIESTFVDTAAIGAMHWYARIEVWSPDVLDVTEGRQYSSAGYGPDKPEAHLQSMRLSAQRRVTKVEKDMNDEPICKVGEYTWRFNSAEEAKAAALRMFKEKFEPGWVLVHEDGTEKVIAENKTPAKKSKHETRRRRRKDTTPDLL